MSNIGKKGKPLVVSIFLVIALFASANLVWLHATADADDIVDQETHDSLYLEYTVVFKEPQLKEVIVDQRSFTQLELPGTLSIAETEGAPIFQVSPFRIVLPAGTVVSDLTVSAQEVVEIDTSSYDINLKDQPLVPFQPFVPIGEPSREFVFDEAAYASTNIVPNKVHEPLDVEYCHGYPILGVNLHPTMYNPGEGRLWYHPTVTIQVSLQETGEVSQFYRDQAEDRARVASLVSNPEILDTYNARLSPSCYEGGLCDPSDNEGRGYDYVIITREALFNFTGTDYNWTDFIEDKEAHGLETTKVTVAAITGCGDYWDQSDSPVLDTPAIIREFCRDAYLDWGTDYILIAGDNDNYNPETKIERRLLHYGKDPVYMEDIESDVYWTHLDKTFNADFDPYWGEMGDAGFDLYAEMYSGSLPCDEPLDVSNWIKKTLYYGNSDDLDYLENAGFYAGNMGWALEGDDCIDFGAILGTDDWLGPDPHLSGPYPSWLGFLFGFETWNNLHPVMQFNLSVRWTVEPPNPGWRGGDATAIDEFRNAINNDHCTLISGTAHANPEWSLDVHYTDWEANYNNTKPFMIYDTGCHSGEMYDEDDGVLHAMLFHSDTQLAFACIYNTGYGWGHSTSTNGSSDLMMKLFWDYYFDVTNNSKSMMNWHIGKAQEWSRDMMAPTINWAGMLQCFRGIIEGCQLFGDPAQTIRLPIPGGNVGVLMVDTLDHVKANELMLINTTIINNGHDDVANVTVRLIVDGSEVDSLLIPSLQQYSEQALTFSWIPTEAGIHSITVNVSAPSIAEYSYEDNEKSKQIRVGVWNQDTDELFDMIQEAIDATNTSAGHTLFTPKGTYHETLVISKGVTLVGEDQHTTIIAGDGCSDVVLLDTDGVTITDFTLMNGRCGIRTALFSSSEGHAISDNIICDNSVHGILLSRVSDTIIADNMIDSNGRHGIHLRRSCTDIVISGNSICDNTNDGITIVSSDRNSIKHNVISTNKYGITLYLCEQNTIHQNNLIDNTAGNAIDTGENSWYDEYPSGGNFWSDYIGDDLFQGPDQDQPGPDGIGDHPYSIAGGTNQDQYPLLYPFDVRVINLHTRACFDTIQNAIDDSNTTTDHILLVRSGTYHENVVIDKSICLLGEDGDTTVINGGFMGDVVRIIADGVTLQGFTLHNAGFDWEFGYDVGLEITSNNNYIEGNLIKDNLLFNIYLDGADDNKITNNMISGSMNGFKLMNSDSNTISWNTIVDNDYSLFAEQSSYNTISKNIVVHNEYGIFIYCGLSNEILNNNASDNAMSGIGLGSTNDNIVKNNIIINNSETGISLGHAWWNTIMHNTVAQQYNGFDIYSSGENTISENTITDTGRGFNMYYAPRNIISKNKITDSSNIGILIDSGSSDTIVTKNTIRNSHIGLLIATTPWAPADTCLIYHNNFINNTDHAFDETPTTQWNTSYPTGGNYWDDYNGTDKYKGPDQNISGPDRIGDTPYPIPGDINEDAYPLMRPWRIHDPQHV